MGIPLTDYENSKYIGQYNPHDHRQTGGLNTAQFMSKQMPNKNKSKPSTTRQKIKVSSRLPTNNFFEEVSQQQGTQRIHQAQSAVRQAPLRSMAGASETS
jgi:hypothetical protein